MDGEPNDAGRFLHRGALEFGVGVDAKLWKFIGLRFEVRDFYTGNPGFNVPVQGSQQMYQALRSLGIDTQLIIYPNENHGIQRPSYQRDRMERYLAWYDKYIKKPTGASSTSTAR